MHFIKLQSEYDDLDKYKFYDGHIMYYKKGTSIFHNPYGPAIISKNCTQHWIENKIHRLDGPAIIYCDGEEKYYINSEYLTEEQFEVHPERLKFLGKEYLLCIM